MPCEFLRYGERLLRCPSCGRIVDPRVFASDAPMVCPAAHSPACDVAVIIPCHNYGRFLAQAIQSALNQTIRPAEIIVIDDASDDDTRIIARRFAQYGVRYEFINARSVYVARRHGLNLTTSPFVVFLDADDVLGADYLERGRACFAELHVGVAYTDLHRFGDEVRVSAYNGGDIERANYIHAGAMARRVALEQSQAYESTGTPHNITADWYAWREMLRAGWRAEKFEAIYHYRQHGKGIHLTGRPIPYAEEANLHLETVPIILPLSGREQWWAQLTGWVTRQTWPRVELIVIDSSANSKFRKGIRAWLAERPCATSYIPVRGTPGLADEDRTQEQHFRAVQRVMPTIYRHLNRTVHEYNLVVEDDVLPPDDAIERLMNAMTADAACVSGVVRSRFQPAVISWDDERMAMLTRTRTGIERIYGSGFGCLLFRRSVFGRVILHHGGGGNFDQEVSRDVAAMQRDWLTDWDVQCVHAGLSVQDLKGA